MSELREVPPKTPVIDAVEDAGKVGRFVAFFLRPLKAWRERRARKKQQEYIDKTWHDPLRVGSPERATVDAAGRTMVGDEPGEGANARREDVP